MSLTLEQYDPVFCDGHYCPKDCEDCVYNEENREDKPRLYTAYTKDKDGKTEIFGYAYGKRWVEMALLMDDIKFDTPEAAKAWWEKNYGEDRS